MKAEKVKVWYSEKWNTIAFQSEDGMASPSILWPHSIPRIPDLAHGHAMGLSHRCAWSKPEKLFDDIQHIATVEVYL